MKVSSHLSLHEDVSQAPVSSKGKGSTEKAKPQIDKRFPICFCGQINKLSWGSTVLLSSPRSSVEGNLDSCLHCVHWCPGSFCLANKDTAEKASQA